MEPEFEAPLEQAADDFAEPYVAPAPGQNGQDNSPLTAEEIAEYGLDPADFPNAQLADTQVVPPESAEVTASSSGSGSPSPTPTPQLDSNQQFMAAMFQQMQAQAAQQQQAFQQALQALAPRQAPAAPVDPFADMPEALRAAVDANPELKAYTEYMHRKNQSSVDSYRSEMDKRIQAASEQRTVGQYVSEAQDVGRTLLTKGFQLNPQASQRVSDLAQDLTLSLAHAHGGNPAQYKEAVINTLEELVQGRLAHFNEQNKSKVQQRGYAPQVKQSPTASAIPQAQSREPTREEVRAAGYNSPFEAALDDYKRVIDMRARRQGRG